MRIGVVHSRFNEEICNALLAGARAYNRWAATLCQDSPERRAGVAVVPIMVDVEAAVAEIRARIVQARNRGAAVLLVSEDLDELLELSDRLVVMFHGQFVHEALVGEGVLHTPRRADPGRAEWRRLQSMADRPSGPSSSRAWMMVRSSAG